MRPIRLILLVAAALSLAGCGSSSDDNGSASSTPASVSSAAEPSSSAPADQSSVPESSAAPAGPAGCTTADLSVTLGSGEGAAGSTYYPITVTNKGREACKTGGFGGVSLVDSPSGDPIGAPADRTQQSDVVAITLQPGQAAKTTLQVTEAGNYDKGRCQPTNATGLRIYPPNETHSAYVKLAAPACANAKVHLLTLRPYQPVG